MSEKKYCIKPTCENKQAGEIERRRKPSNAQQEQTPKKSFLFGILCGCFSSSDNKKNRIKIKSQSEYLPNCYDLTKIDENNHHKKIVKGESEHLRKLSEFKLNDENIHDNSNHNFNQVISSKNRRKSCNDDSRKFESIKGNIVPLDERIPQKQESDYQLNNISDRKISNVLKGSWDSSTKQASGTNNEPCSNSKLRMKAEEFKSSNIVNDCFNEECERVKNNTPNDIKSSQNINNDLTDRSCNKSHHANKSKSSSSYINHHLDESCLPPQEIDNSAILFSNTKRRETKLKNEQLLNALNPEENKSNHEGSIYDNSKVNYGENNNEEQSAGEGESYSSSCSCSSCLRERNADNGVSLKLSQYDYKPTYIDHQTLSDDEKTPNTQNQKYKKSLRKESSPRYFYKRNEDQECQSSDYSPSVNNKTIEDYPDNLNNGKFKFRMMK